ncbi:substrate-binding domain-containing protein [Alkalibaculum sp. M08DMB]|uniref:Substrate-binding domain-containing protein n=1 Tax=Alkalibaculum sporogenes TaxID=2655001 RepID=A0A6A7K4X3_9FIRM|nr:sugar ABC transporter substrate-binding protein [Alkalibaculum sporogenes]MPW24374.1 substrate-binding domain-containing protein [Alkalibaculum sporogenes]
MKRSKFKVLALLTVIAMVGSFFMGCGNSEEGKDTEKEASGEVIGAYQQLMEKEDRLPLSGLQPLKLEDRTDVDKALPVEKKEKVVIGWAGAFLGSSFFEEMINSANLAADKYGYTLNFQNANFDLQSQLTQVETFVSQGVDIIVLNAVEIDSSVAAIRRAVSEGIPVIVTGPRQASDDYPVVTTVLSGSFNSGFAVGEQAAKELFEKDGEPLKVGLALSMMDSADAQSRPTGFIAGYLYESANKGGTPYKDKWEATLAAYDIWITIRDQGKFLDTGMGLEFVGYGTGEATDAAAGQIASSDLLTANPDMDILFVETDSMLPGVFTEVRQHNLVPGDDVLLICAADGTREALKYIKEGVLYSTATNIPSYNGEKIVDLINRMFAEGFDANNLPANSFTPTMSIHAGNVDEYYDENSPFAKAGPWDIQTTEEYNEFNAQYLD